MREPETAKALEQSFTSRWIDIGAAMADHSEQIAMHDSPGEHDDVAAASIITGEAATLW